VLGKMQGQHLLMAELLYGAGLRLMECVRLRVNSLDMDRGLIYVVKTTEIYTHVMQKNIETVTSPLDSLLT